MKLIDMTGQVIGKLTVLNRVQSSKQAKWLCRCQCGNESIVSGYELRHSIVKSCGCTRIELASKLNLTHGKSKSKIYRTYHNIINRCYRATNQDFPRYGGVGIKMCDRWLESFDNFYADMGDVPENHSIDRIDSKGNYEPNNCKWSTIDEQQNNRRHCIYINYLGKHQTLMQWCKELNLPYKTIRARITDYGWEPIKALTTQVRQLKT